MNTKNFFLGLSEIPLSFPRPIVPKNQGKIIRTVSTGFCSLIIGGLLTVPVWAQSQPTAVQTPEVQNLTAQNSTTQNSTTQNLTTQNLTTQNSTAQNSVPTAPVIGEKSARNSQTKVEKENAQLLQTNETEIKSEVKSVGIFKNGVVLVQEEIAVPGSGQYVLKDIPKAIHGSFYIESNAKIQTRTTKRTISVPGTPTANLDYVQLLAGKSVRIFLKNPSSETQKGITGTVRALPEDAKTFDSSELTPESLISNENKSNSAAASLSPADSTRFSPLLSSRLTQTVLSTEKPSDPEEISPSYLLLDNADGTSILPMTEILRVDVLGEKPFVPAPVPDKKISVPVLVFDVQIPDRKDSAALESAALESDALGSAAKNSAEQKDNFIRLTYLTKGLNWAPSYQVDLFDAQKLKLVQSATIINAWKDLKNAEIFLISGFPQIEFINSRSLIDPTLSMEAFFQSLSQRSTDYGNSSINRNAVISQQMVMSNAFIPSATDDNLDNWTSNNVQETGGEGADVYYQPIGVKSILKDERLHFETESAETEYQRLTIWNIPQTRDKYGNAINSDRPVSDVQRFEEPWDVIQFRNPFSFPMTTAPATVFGNGKFYGQNTSFWTNPNEKTVLPLTKSLSLRTMSTEQEITVDKDGEIIKIPVRRYDGYDYRQISISADIQVVNQKKETVNFLVRRNIFGEIEIQDGAKDAPAVKALTNNLNNLNRQYELSWNLELKPGETKKITFTYTTWVRH